MWNAECGMEREREFGSRKAKGEWSDRGERHRRQSREVAVSEAGAERIKEGSVCRSSGLREKDGAAVFQVEALAAVGFLEKAFHFPGSRNQLIEFGYLAARE